MSCEYLTNSLGFRHTINLNRNEHCYALVLTILLIYGVQNLTLQNNYTSNEQTCQGYLKKLKFLSKTLNPCYTNKYSTFDVICQENRKNTVYKHIYFKNTNS